MKAFLLITAFLLMQTGFTAEAQDKNNNESGLESVGALIRTAPISIVQGGHQIEGIGYVLSPDSLLQSHADIAIAEASAAHSRMIFNRDSNLYADDQTVSKEEFELARRQSNSDLAQLSLLTNRLKLNWGINAPFIDQDKRQVLVDQLSSGEKSLIRMDFPEEIRGEINHFSISSFQGNPLVEINDYWDSPDTNPSLPGSSFYSIVSGSSYFLPGAVVRVSAEIDSNEMDFSIPVSAIIFDAGEAWCFIKTGENDYERRKVALNNPVDHAYLNSTGFRSGEEIVVQGAGLLLSTETEAVEEE